MTCPKEKDMFNYFKRKDGCHETLDKTNQSVQFNLQMKGSRKDKTVFVDRILKAKEIYKKFGMNPNLNDVNFIIKRNSDMDGFLGTTKPDIKWESIDALDNNMIMTSKSTEFIITIELAKSISNEAIESLKQDYNISYEISDEDAKIIVITHELGHLYDFQLKFESRGIHSWKMEGNEEWAVAYFNRGISQYIIPKVLSIGKWNFSDVEYELNGYPMHAATTDNDIDKRVFYHEAFAEALTESLVSNNPRKFARLVLEQTKMLKEKNAAE